LGWLKNKVVKGGIAPLSRAPHPLPGVQSIIHNGSRHTVVIFPWVYVCHALPRSSFKLFHWDLSYPRLTFPSLQCGKTLGVLRLVVGTCNDFKGGEMISMPPSACGVLISEGGKILKATMFTCGELFTSAMASLHLGFHA
jgi:hypothetical protein